MNYSSADICTIYKPNFDDLGNIYFEDLGDYFCRIEPGNRERYIPKVISHKVKMDLDGAKPGWVLITTHHNYLIVTVDKTKQTLGLVIQE